MGDLLAVSLPIALPAIATTVILNFILLWNEFLYAVVLITDEANRTLPLGIQRFMGDQLEDVGMIATGLMIAIVPVIIVYALLLGKAHPRHDRRSGEMSGHANGSGNARPADARSTTGTTRRWPTR